MLKQTGLSGDLVQQAEWEKATSLRLTYNFCAFLSQTFDQTVSFTLYSLTCTVYPVQFNLTRWIHIYFIGKKSSLMQWYWCNDIDAMILMQWYWCNDIDEMILMQWYWCNDIDAMVLMQWYWCNDIDAMILMQWYWCNDIDAMILMQWYGQLFST